MFTLRRLLIRSFVLVLVCAPASADDSPASVLNEVLEAKKTPSLVRQIEASDPAADTVRARLVSDAPAAAKAAAAFLEAAEKLAKRDGKLAIAFADWLVASVAEARKAATTDAALCRGLAEAWLVRARIGSALKDPGDGSAWMNAAASFVEQCGLTEDESEKAAAGVQAIAALHEGARAKGTPASELLDRAAVVSEEVLKAHGESDGIRREVAAACAGTARALAKGSRKEAAKALAAYFDAFAPIAEPEEAYLKDAVAFNEMVTFAATNKIDSKTGYITEDVMVADDLLTVSVPRTGRWDEVAGTIREQESAGELSRNRVLAFQAYRWKKEYRVGGKGKTVLGDDIKSLAKGKYDDLTSHKKVKKKKKPSRRRFNKSLPQGRGFLVERIDTRGTRIRFTVYFFKLPEAKRTIRITLLEYATKAAGKDPEIQALYDSLRLTE